MSRKIEQLETQKTENETANKTDAGNVEFNFSGYAETQPEEADAQKEAQALLNTPSVDVEQLLGTVKDYAKPVPEQKRRRGRKTKAEKEAEEKQAEQEAIVIPGILAVTVCDSVAVGSLSLLDMGVSKIFKTQKVDIERLALTDEQKITLAPLAEKAFAAMNLQRDPISAFFGSLMFMYIGNYMTLRAMTSNNEPKLFNLRNEKKQ